MKIEKLKISFIKHMQCSMVCSDGSGRKTTVHQAGCPFYISSPYYNSMLSQKEGEK